MTLGRRLTIGRKSQADHESLLVNPTSVSSGDAKQNRGFNRNGDHNTEYPSGDSLSPSLEFLSGAGKETTSASAHTTTTTTMMDSRLAPEHRFLPQHKPRGSPHSNDAEIPPTEGILQFVPAYDESSATPAPDTSWDAILHDDPHHHQQHNMNGLVMAGGSRIGKPEPQRHHPYQQQYQPQPHYSSHSSINKKKIDVDPRLSGQTSVKSKGPRIARLAALFSSKSTGGGHSTNEPSSHNKSTSYSTHASSTLPSSPSRSSSSGGFVGWPGTQDKRGETVALNQSSYEDSDVGPARRDTFQDYDDDDVEEEENQHHHPHNISHDAAEAAWMNSSIFNDISGVAPDDSGFLGGDTRDNYQENHHHENLPDLYLADAMRNAIRHPPPPPPPRGANVKQQPISPSTSGRADFQHQHQQHHNRPQQIFPNAARWGGDGDTPSSSSPSRSSVSKNSSAYFDADVRPMAFPAFSPQDTQAQDAARVHIASAVMRHGSSIQHPLSQPPTEEALAVNNRLRPPHRTLNARGYRGLLNKTQEVPNLIDETADSDSMASSSKASSAVDASSGHGGYLPNNSNNHGRQYHGSAMPSVHEEPVSRDSADSDVFDEISKYSLGNSGESELFEGIAPATGTGEESQMMAYRMRDTATYKTIDTADETKHKQRNSTGVKVVLLGGGLTTIQTTTTDFANRLTASEVDEALSNSDVDQFGFTKLPSFQEMAAAGRSVNDNASVIDNSISVDPSQDSRSLPSERGTNQKEFSTKSVAFGKKNGSEASYQENKKHSTANKGAYRDDESAFYSDFYSGEGSDASGELAAYYIQPHVVKRLVRKYRKMSRQAASCCHTYEEMDRAEDEKKVFALFEMRSRIMERDIERGLERRGGTSVVDDLVLTPYFQTAMQIRDAVIVSKAWRDGANPRDVVNTANLTRRAERSYFIKRPISPKECRQNSGKGSILRYRWEEVTWVDDTQFSTYRCPSLGPRNLRGFEMFTIGDCQSILLKLTNERCMVRSLDVMLQHSLISSFPLT